MPVVEHSLIGNVRTALPDLDHFGSYPTVTDLAALHSSFFKESDRPAHE